MRIDDELQRRFDRAGSAIDLEPGSLDQVRARASARTRTNRALSGLAAAATVVVLAAIAIGLNPSTATEPELEVASIGQATADVVETAGQVTEADFTYLGAFVAPAGEVDGTTFAFGGEAAAFNPFGDPTSSDGFDGSIFVTSHVRQNVSVGELSIPAPELHDGTTDGLPIAQLLGNFGDVTGGRGLPFVGSAEVGGQDEYRYGGLEVVDGPSGPRLHWSIWQYQNLSNNDVPGHGHSSLDLANPDPQGPWYLGDLDNRLTAGYLFAVPEPYAAENLGGQRLVAGFRSGPATQGRSWGPPFYSYSTPEQAEPGSRIDANEIASYDLERALAGFGQADTAAGAAWVSTSRDAEAIITVGSRGLGEVIQGAPRETDCSIYSGVHAGPYEPLVMFYDPVDLARAATGEIEPWELQPYRTWNPSEHLIPSCDWRLSSISFDPDSGRLYVVQMEADTSQSEFSPVPVIHVFQT